MTAENKIKYQVTLQAIKKKLKKVECRSQIADTQNVSLSAQHSKKKSSV